MLESEILDQSQALIHTDLNSIFEQDGIETRMPTRKTLILTNLTSKNSMTENGNTRRNEE